MTLDELAAAASRASPAPTPAWTWGCWRRRTICFAGGQEDAASHVVRLQGQGITGELRVPAWRPDVKGRGSFQACTVEELLELSAVDGGVADAAFGAGQMTWDNASAFQPYPRWPEPGQMQRVGPGLIEFAPSGACLQDWRLQPRSSGLHVALRLMFETGLDGLTRPRDGGLIICGEHCLFSLDRRRPLPSDAPVQQQMRQAGDPYAFAEMAFDGETSYARRQANGAFKVELSTDPFREGRIAPVLGDFVTTSISEVLRQVIGEGTDRIVRQWRIDTLIPDAVIGLATDPDKAGAAWLKREGKVLLRGL
jgi:hypothetical protein